MSLTRVTQFARWIFRVPPSGPDENRRRAMLARISVFMAVFSLIVLREIVREYSFSEIISGYYLRDLWQSDDARRLFTSMLIGGVSFALLWIINRWRLGAFGWVPGVLVMGIVTMLVANADAPAEIADGRSLMLWVLPIALAPLLLPSWAVFAESLFITAVLAVVAAEWFNIYAVLYLYVIAFVSWLAARSLEQALMVARNEAQKNQVILENVADGVLVVDNQGKVVLANLAAHSLLGTDISQAANQADLRAEHRGRVIEYSWAQVQGVGRVAILRDITRQVEIDRAKDAMLGVVSHELRTPLAAISGFADVIGLMSQDDQVRDMAGRIVSNVGRLTNLVNSLLDQAQIQAGGVKLNITTFSPEKVAREVYNLMNGLAAEKNLDFNLELDAELPESVLGDAERVRQVLVNLAGNAIKFTEQGRVTMHLFRATNERWAVSVRDTGDGIPPARQPDIFKPFRRASDYATRSHQGAGLGLSISKRLVELMGGEISVQSEVVQGSVFTVILPTGDIYE